MSDLFHERLPFEDVDRVFAVMALCPHLTFQILTKRPDRMRAYCEALRSGERRLGDSLRSIGEDRLGTRLLVAQAYGVRPGSSGLHPYRSFPNVWLGVSVEDQQTADARIPVLLDTPAAVRFVSYEPALGPVDFRRWLGGSLDPTLPAAVIADRWGKVGLNWLIVGGESGPGARPFDVAWARSAVGQCKAAWVACFVKQLGDRAMMRVDSIDGRRAGDDPEREWPIGTLFGTAPSHMGTEWQGRWAHARAPYLNGRCVGLPVRFSKGCSAPSEWPEDLRVREFPEVERG